MDLIDFEASLGYRASSRTTRTVTQRNPVSKNKQTKSQKPKSPTWNQGAVSKMLAAQA